MCKVKNLTKNANDTTKNSYQTRMPLWGRNFEQKEWHWKILKKDKNIVRT